MKPGNRGFLLALLLLQLGAAPSLSVWLPYPAGTEARCGQGPYGSGSHKGGFAYDLELPEGTPILASAPGRVIQVVDDKTVEGTQQFYDANRIVVDVGAGRFLSYVHHRPGSARVRAGQRVRVGQVLALVGKSGTIVPHIHLDLRGPTWERTWPLRFRTATGETELATGDAALSVTSQGNSAFPETGLERHAFSANGIELRTGPRAFWWRAGQELEFRGRVTHPATRVRFALWEDQKASEILVDTPVDERGHFELTVQLPPALSGPRWYRLDVPDETPQATLPVGILPRR